MDNNTFINSHLEGTGYKGTDTSLHRVETRVDKSGESFVVETKLANGCIIGLKHIIRDNGAEIEDKLSLVALADGKASPQFEINRKDLENNLMQYVPLNFRPTVGGNAKAYIVDSIRAQAVNMSELTVYQHTGWRIINDKPVFLNASGAIGMDGVTVDLEGRLSKYRFSEEKHEERWKTLKLFTEVAPHSVTYPLLSVLDENTQMNEPTAAIYKRELTESEIRVLEMVFDGYSPDNLANRVNEAAKSDELKSLIMLHPEYSKYLVEEGAE